MLNRSCPEVWEVSWRFGENSDIMAHCKWCGCHSGLGKGQVGDSFDWKDMHLMRPQGEGSRSWVAARSPGGPTVSVHVGVVLFCGRAIKVVAQLQRALSRAIKSYCCLVAGHALSLVEWKR